MWTCSFKIIMQIEIKEHLSVRLTSQTTEFTAFVAGYVFFFVGSAFHFGFIITLKTLLFPEIYLGMYVKPMQTHNELALCPPVEQIRRTSIGR